jgi:thiol-disulfide isomerase/thioredoxin
MSSAGPDSPPPPPKPRALGPRFWTGFGFGILGVLAVLFAAFFLLTLWMKRYVEQASGERGAGAFLTAPPFPAAGAPADYALAIETMDGLPYDAAALKGRTVFLNYWATWCGPCRAEMPSIERLHARTRDLGVVFLLVSEEKRDKISDYLRKSALSVPVFRATGTRPSAYRTSGIPATFILSADGRIAFKHVGAAKWDDDSTLAFLRGLKPPATP